MKSFITKALLVLFIITVSSSVLAQKKKSGIISYEMLVSYNFEGVYDHPKWDMLINKLPKKAISYFDLTFNEKKALYAENISKREPISGYLQVAIEKVGEKKGPKETLRKVFTDLVNNKKLEEVEFMTREFLIESKLEVLPWKITTDKIKVLNYVCTGAELKDGDDTIVAYFTSEIPVSIGPDKYNSLPGAVLAVEKNGELMILATSVEIKDVEVEELKKLKRRKFLSSKEFDIIKKDKIEEFNRTLLSRNNKNKKGKQ